jgi:hypothetical protein
LLKVHVQQLQSITPHCVAIVWLWIENWTYWPLTHPTRNCK